MIPLQSLRAILGSLPRLIREYHLEEPATLLDGCWFHETRDGNQREGKVFPQKSARPNLIVSLFQSPFAQLWAGEIVYFHFSWDEGSFIGASCDGLEIVKPSHPSDKK